ncbi:esterase [Proteus mirabilis]|uniref:Esterase n=1 Tax=Proteus mirabilis TaxID=584 RepID=A0A2X2DQP2_PROMI|nr:esterase [Proteus mirabilis]
MNNIERHACFGGWQEVYQHTSTTLNCEMKFAIYLPPMEDGQKISGFILVIRINL